MSIGPDQNFLIEESQHYVHLFTYVQERQHMDATVKTESVVHYSKPRSQ